MIVLIMLHDQVDGACNFYLWWSAVCVLPNFVPDYLVNENNLGLSFNNVHFLTSNSDKWCNVNWPIEHTVISNMGSMFSFIAVVYPLLFMVLILVQLIPFDSSTLT